MNTTVKLFSKLKMVAVGATALLISSGCETTGNKDDEQIVDEFMPTFVRDAELIAAEVTPASETALEVNKIVPERAAGDDELVLPNREIKTPESAPVVDFPAELIKGMKDPKKKIPVELDFDATPLTDVLPIFAGMLEFDYLVDPAVKGTVSINVNASMNAREVWSTLEHILWLSGAYVSRNNQFVEILPFAKMPKTRRLLVKHNPANVDVSFLNLVNIPASEAMANIKPFMTDGATVTEIKRLNSLLIVESPSNMPKIRELVSKLDQQWHRNWPQASIRCHSVDVETIIEELQRVMPIIGLPAVFDTAKAEGTEIKIAGIPRLQVIVVSAPMVEAIKEVERWIKTLDSEDIGEQEHIFFYNVKHGTIEGLRAALDTFFMTDGAKSSSSTRKKSTSSKAGNTSSRLSSRPSTTRSTTSKNQSESNSRSTVFDEAVTIYEDTFQNRLVIRTTPRTYALIKAMLERVDIPPLQVVIQATIVDLTLTEGLEYGFRYAVDNGSGQGAGSGVLSPSNPSVETTSSTTINPGGVPPETTTTITTKGVYVSALDKLKGLGGLDPLGGGNSGLNLLFEDGNGALNFIASIAGRDNTSIVSAPQIVAISDEEAVIDVTDEKPVEEVNFDSNGNPTTSSWTKIDASTTLTVIPHITANNEVTLEVEQKFEEFGQAVQGGGENPSTSYPVLRRSMDTKLVVPDGKTVLLGGMIKNKATEKVQGVPLLMDIPWIGEFFKYTKKGVSRNELLVLLTVNVIDSDTRMGGLLKRYNQSLRAMDKVLSDEASLGEPLNIIDDIIERQEELKRRRERKDLIKKYREKEAGEVKPNEPASEAPIVIIEE